MSGNKKVYIAGPGVFCLTPGHHDEIRKLVSSFGFTPLYPLDNELSNPFDIKKSNQDMIREADFVLADIMPFRGVSADPGTTYEIGFAEALGKPVYRYSLFHRHSYLSRIALANIGFVSTGDVQYTQSSPQAHQMFVENFGQTDNLMFGLNGNESPEDHIYQTPKNALKAMQAAAHSGD